MHGPAAGQHEDVPYLLLFDKLNDVIRELHKMGGNVEGSSLNFSRSSLNILRALKTRDYTLRVGAFNPQPTVFRHAPSRVRARCYFIAARRSRATPLAWLSG
jgi:hypothetical protein